jgi:hypothetical protein
LLGCNGFMGYGDQAAGHYGAGLVDDAVADAGCWCAAGILLDQGELFWNAVVFLALDLMVY